MSHRIRYALAAPLLAAAAALIVSSIALLAIGENPIDAFRAMWESVNSADAVANIINAAAPYYVPGLAVALGFKMGLFNIGADGQYRLGRAVRCGGRRRRDVAGTAARAVHHPRGHGGRRAPTPPSPAILKVIRGVNEVVSTIMLNFIATGIIGLPADRVLPQRPERRPAVARRRRCPSRAGCRR